MRNLMNRLKKMASSEQLKALRLSHLSGDDDRFLSIALQVAAHEARIGHGKLAVELRDIVEKGKKKAKSVTPVSIAKGLKDTSGLLYVTTPQVRFSDLVTTHIVKEKLAPVVREQRHLGKIKSHGLAPRRRLLLVGPPGTGKTFTASVLAGELGYPLFQVRLDAVITKFMGESAAKLRQVFDAIREVRGVYGQYHRSRLCLLFSACPDRWFIPIQHDFSHLGKSCAYQTRSGVRRR